MVPTGERRPSQTFLLGIIVFVLVAAVLYVARAVVVLVVLAAFFGILLLPAVSWLHRYVPRWLAVLAVLLVMVLLVAAGSALILVNVDGIAAKVPFYSERFEEMFREVARVADGLGIDIGQAEGGVWLSRALRFLAGSLEAAASAVGQMVVVGLLVVFILLDAPLMGRKLEAAISSDRRDELLSTMRSITSSVQRYMVLKTLVALSIAILSGLALLAVGVDFPFLWAFLTFLLNYIPNLGIVIAVIPPVLLAFIQFGSLGRPLVSLAALLAIQVGIGNFLEPRILGRSMNLAPLAVLLAVVLWGWLWGIIGVILAVPLTVMLQIVFRYTAGLRTLAVLLGGTEEPEPGRGGEH